MKIKFQYKLWFLLPALFAACKKDNFDSPKSKLTGAILYRGDTVRVGSQQVHFELWQSGFGKRTPINVNIDQNGVFSALLFDGHYKLDFPSGQGPFLTDQINTKDHSDTLSIDINGNTMQNIEVIPFYMIRDLHLSNQGDEAVATLKLEKIVKDVNAKDVDNVILYVNKTDFVDNNNNIAASSVAGNDINDLNNIKLQVVIPDLVPDQDYVFARIGVKIQNVEDRIFSGIVKLNLK